MLARWACLTTAAGLGLLSTLGPVIGQRLIDTITPRAAELGVELVPPALADLSCRSSTRRNTRRPGVHRQEHTRRWSTIVDAADGFIAVPPEGASAAHRRWRRARPGS